MRKQAIIHPKRMRAAPFHRFVGSMLLPICVSILSVPVFAADKSPQASYEKLCGVCHGNQGNGEGRASANLIPAPTDFTSPLAQQSLNRARIESAIRDGRPGTAMSGYGQRLTAQQISGITDYMLASFFGGKSARVATAHDGVKDVGRQIYINNCSACHGDNGNTAVWARNGLNPPPRNFTAPEAKDDLSLERMILSVTYGRPGTGMMPFQSRLSEQEIKSVVGYIRSEFMGLSAQQPQVPELAQMPKVATVTAHATAIDMKAPMPNQLLGDIKKGEQFYQHNCFTCHGRTGQGDGPRAFFNTPKPRNFTTEETRALFNRPRLFDAITHGKPGSVMPAWGKVLNEQQIADVAEYVFRTFVSDHAVKKKH